MGLTEAVRVGVVGRVVRVSVRTGPVLAEATSGSNDRGAFFLVVVVVLVVRTLRAVSGSLPVDVDRAFGFVERRTVSVFFDDPSVPAVAFVASVPVVDVITLASEPLVFVSDAPLVDVIRPPLLAADPKVVVVPEGETAPEVSGTVTPSITRTGRASVVLATLRPTVVSDTEASASGSVPLVSTTLVGVVTPVASLRSSVVVPDPVAPPFFGASRIRGDPDVVGDITDPVPAVPVVPSGTVFTATVLIFAPLVSPDTVEGNLRWDMKLPSGRTTKVLTDFDGADVPVADSGESAVIPGPVVGTVLTGFSSRETSFSGPASLLPPAIRP